MHYQSLCQTQSITSKMKDSTTLWNGSTNIPLSLTTTFQKPCPHPQPYPDQLQLQTSSLRPHCLAQDRLRLWHPPQSHQLVDRAGKPLPLPSSILEQLQSLLTSARSENTQATFGLGLLAFHKFCDEHKLPEQLRAPCSPDLLSAFVASLAGIYIQSNFHVYIPLLCHILL